MERAISGRHAPPKPLNAVSNHHIQSNMKLRILILPLLLSLALMVGCAGEFQSTGSGSSAASDSSSDSWNETQARINEQAALDAANAAAQQQNNDAMAAAQQTMNQHNDEFNRGLDLHQ